MKKLNFSQRMGVTPISKELQLNEIDEDLRNGLWNVIKVFFLDKLKESSRYYTGSDYQTFTIQLWHSFFKQTIDSIPEDYDIYLTIRERYFDFKWNEIYHFIEFIIENDFMSVDTYKLIQQLNSILEKEFSGYRIVNCIVAPISNELEITEIETAIENVIQFTGLHGANTHLSKALIKLSDREIPDYSNSIKESISSIEVVCRTMTGESTLGKALKLMKSKGVIIDENILGGIEKIYAFANNKESGVRHGIIEPGNTPDFNDAKFMIVISSAFINYLIGKKKSL